VSAEAPKAAGLLGRLRALRGRPDTEHEMSFNRLAFALIITLYLVLEDAPGHAIEVVAAYWVVALALFTHILARPATNIPRRITALVLDMGFLSYELYAGGEVTSVLAPIYLWVILGNGFRFGVRWLRGAMLAAILGFAFVVWTTPFWHDQPHLTAGFMLGLLVIPAYAGTLIRKLSDAKRQAEAASQAKTMFLAGVSHELRTPLHAIIGMGGLLQRADLKPEEQEMARTVSDAGQHLLGLIDGLLDFSRIEAGQMQVRAAPFDPAALLDEARRMLAGQARDKGLRLTLHITPRVPSQVVGDAALVRDLLINLGGNALKFTAQGSVTLALDAPPGDAASLRFEVSDTGIGIAPEARSRIFEAFTQADGTISNRFGGTGLGLALCRRTVELLGGRIGVESEEGKGSTFWIELPLGAAPGPDARPEAEAVLLAPEASSRIAAWAQEPSLAGLKLRPAASLAEAVAVMGGEGEPRLLLVDAPGLGLDPANVAQVLGLLDPAGDWRCVLLGHEAAGLPPLELRRAFAAVVPAPPEGLAAALRAVAPHAAPAAEPQEAQAPEEPRPARRRLTILVADDNRTNLRVAQRILESGGHETVLVGTAELALDALEERDFDLVLMDLNMPDLDGFAALKHHRVQSLGRRQVPWAALTADATEETLERCQEAGFVERLVKPVAPAALLAAVERLAPPEAAPKPAVAPIASHPRFRTRNQLLLDPRALEGLEALGGKDFLQGVVDDFLLDAEEILQGLRAAVAAADSVAYRSRAHALHSAAANVGAIALCELCRAAKDANPRVLREDGPTMLARIAAELGRVTPLLIAAAQEEAPGRSSSAS
jgi:two-component system sensor histidine kinase RpfC